MIFLCLLPSPIPLFHYLKITRRTIFLSMLVAREHMAMYQPKESQVREEQEARALASWIKSYCLPSTTPISSCVNPYNRYTTWSINLSVFSDRPFSRLCTTSDSSGSL